jgi:hypothetical protein
MQKQWRLVVFALGLAIAQPSQAIAQQDQSAFPKGELSNTKNHTGDI